MGRGITTHVLDLHSGQPGAGIAVALGQGDTLLASGITDDDGRVARWSATPELVAGDYWLRFEVGAWRAARGVEGFYPQVLIHFSVADPQQHYHVPLLLSPYGYSTYRGS